MLHEMGDYVRLGQLKHHIPIAFPMPSGTAKTIVEIRTWSRRVPGATRQTSVSDGNIATYRNVVSFSGKWSHIYNYLEHL